MLDKLMFWKRESETATDPVCGMTVHKANPPGGAARHEGETYYFCGHQCRQQFVDDPKQFAGKS